MLSAKSFRDEARVLRFVELLRSKTDGKCLDRLGARTRHQRHDDGGIYASAQQRPQRHITDQTDAYGLFQPPLQLVQAFFFADRRVRAVLGQVPILANLHFAVAEFHQVPCGQFADALERGVRIGDVAEIEILEHTFRIDLRQFWVQSEDRLDL